ncbi:hypothetical protein [Janthinobacterium sp.]|uniref:hypothetical protein n=1 Tax=Janthinobacterium sp. TaxID=1871054 RepID=UPI002590DB85|nr:hypothetical protein [Janthinobacterium sp.]MCX7294646.1 hypothetical protein [Janthinobacterium sp.]
MLARAARPFRTLDTFHLDVLGRAPSTSLLLSGAADAILVNAQFLRDDAAQLAHTIAASGKRLTTIYISAAEPQAYFGLGVLQHAFPHARILASGAAVEAIRRQAGARVAYWGGILKHNAPRCIVMPQPYEGSSLQLEGRHVELHCLVAALN